MDFHVKGQTSISGLLPKSLNGGISSNCSLSYQNDQMKAYNTHNVSYVTSPSRVHGITESPCSTSYARTLRHESPSQPIQTSQTPSSQMGSEYNSSPQQILLSAAIANIIPKLTSSLDWNVDLNIDVNSPEFVGMVSAAATHYANMGIGSSNTFPDSSTYKNDSNNQVIQNESNSSPPTMIESEYSSSQVSSSSPLVQKSSFPRHRTTSRLNKFVRRLHDMLVSEKDNGVVEWRCGLLVLHSTDAFAKNILPKYFNTRNFKTFRRQLNYYGFVHVRSFSATGSTTTALWVNQDLASKQAQFANEPDNISSVLLLKRVDPCPDAKTAEGRRVRKEEAVNTVEDIGINTQWMQLSQIKRLTKRLQSSSSNSSCSSTTSSHTDRNIPDTINTAQKETSLEFYENKTYVNEESHTRCIDDFENGFESPSENVQKDVGSLKIMANNDNLSSSCNDAANLLLNLSRSACVSP